MEQVLLLVVLLACPLMMMFMMRRSHGGHGDHMSSGNADHAEAMTDSDARITELEHQVANLQTRLAEDDDAAAASGGNRMSAGRAHAGVR